MKWLFLGLALHTVFLSVLFITHRKHMKEMEKRNKNFSLLRDHLSEKSKQFLNKRSVNNDESKR